MPVRSFIFHSCPTQAVQMRKKEKKMMAGWFVSRQESRRADDFGSVSAHRVVEECLSRST
jgi:hypothetical protein